MSYSVNTQTFNLPEDLNGAVGKELDAWKRDDKIGRLWNRDQTIWTNEDEAKWLGWLDIVEKQIADAKKFSDFAGEVAAGNFTHAVLLGMGGSSLGPEVLSLTFGRSENFPEFHILDSTVPAQVKALESRIDLARTLFFVSSKSGSTLEPNVFKQYFFERVAEAVGKENAGRQFVAITDPNSKMQAVAEADDFRHIFYGLPSIGGRFSVLSDFGMIPLAAMGVDVSHFLQLAKQMVDACKSHLPHENPGVMLGAVLGAAHTFGRDKLTIFTSPEIHDLGAWLEQLIAESTGKNGAAIIPVHREELSGAASYADDRVFVFLKLQNDSMHDAAIAELSAAGHPVVEITLPDVSSLGQEFFRWEMATAVAGSIMRINPFDQPDVEFSKVETRKLTDEFEQTGHLPDEKPFYEAAGIKLFSDARNISDLDGAAGAEKNLANYLKAHFDRIRENDYFALLGYVEMNAETEKLMQAIRGDVFKAKKVATCLGFGPRFLHSTGQAYKGGANNGVFLQITADDAADLLIPKQKYTFGTIKAAQSRGDFQVLVDRNRRALRVHLGGDVEVALSELSRAVREALA